MNVLFTCVSDGFVLLSAKGELNKRNGRSAASTTSADTKTVHRKKAGYYGKFFISH